MAVTTIKSYNSDNQAEVTAAHELKVTGNFTANNSSVGPTGDPVPADATLVGGTTPSGDLAALKLDSSGNLLVSTAGFVTQDVIVKFNEVTAIAVGVETTINTYTAPPAKTSYLLSILAAGGNRARFNIYLDSVAFDSQYTQVTQLTGTFDYKTGSGSVPGMVIPVGSIVDVKTINNGGSIADFTARFLILEVT